MSKIKFIFIILIVFLASFMLTYPDAAKNGAIAGLLICSNTIIPTLFPFTFCVLFITNAINTSKTVNSRCITHFLFGLTQEEFFILLLSFIGGYPTGAALINDYSRNNSVSEKKCNVMLCYCTNAGPAFIVMAVGVGVLHSKAIGWLLLLAHITSSLILALILKKFATQPTDFKKIAKKDFSILENFITSTKNAASSTLSVCIYVVLFSVINVFFEHINEYIPFFKNISSLMEVTTAVFDSTNIYRIAFILSFGGVCVWCQILAIVKNFKVKISYFIIARVLQGILSIFIMYLLLKIFKIPIETFSNLVSFKSHLSVDSTTLTFALIIMAMLFIIATFNSPSNATKMKLLTFMKKHWQKR